MNVKNLLKFLKILKVKNISVSGNKVIGSCPLSSAFHAKKTDSRPSFAAYSNKGKRSGFVCKACLQKGALPSLAFLYARENPSSNLTYSYLKNLIDELEGSKHNPLSFEDFNKLGSIKKEENTRFVDLKLSVRDFLFNKILKNPMWRHLSEANNNAYTYLINRGITPETSLKLGLYNDPIDKRIVFPVYDLNLRCCGFTGRDTTYTSKRKVKDYSGLQKSKVILGCEFWSKGKSVLIVEGLFDYAKMHEIGIARYYNIGALLGADMSEQKADILKKFNHAVYLLLDNDKAGRSGIFGIGSYKGAAYKLIGHVPVFVPEYPEGKAEPDDFDFDELKHILDNSRLLTLK